MSQQQVQQVVDHETTTLKLYESASRGLGALKDLLSAIFDAQTLQINERLILWRQELPTFTQIVRLTSKQDEDSPSPDLLVGPHEAFLCIPIDSKVELVISGEKNALTKAVNTESIERLFPHIRQALTLCHKIGQQKQEMKSLDQVLDHYPIPIMAVDNRLDTIFTNKMAREKFSHVTRNRATDLVSQLQHKAREHLDLLNLCETQTQRLSLRESLQICTSSNDETALCNISVEGTNYPVIISATESVPNKFCHYSRSSIAWVYIIDASYGRHLADNNRFQNLSLSKTEKELCIQLFEGKPLSDIASHRRVSEQTVRKQLQSTLRKTELESQEELIIFLFEQCIEYGLVK